MVEWSRDYYIDPATTGLNTVRVMKEETAPGQTVSNDVDGQDVMEEKGVAAAGGVRHGMGTGKHGNVTVFEGEEGRGASLEEYEMRKRRKEKMQQGIQL